MLMHSDWFFLRDLFCKAIPMMAGCLRFGRLGVDDSLSPERAAGAGPFR
jgi:hypothetical protein